MGAVLGRCLPCMAPQGDVAMPEYPDVRRRLPKEPLDHISEERSSQMRSFESSRKESDGRRDSNESTARKQRRSAGDSLDRQRLQHGQIDPETKEDKEFLDSASDVSDLPALPNHATYHRHHRGVHNAGRSSLPNCLNPPPSSETPRSNRSSCTMEAVDFLEEEGSSKDTRMMDSFLEQERKNSFERNSSINSTYGGSSMGSTAEERLAVLNRAWLIERHV